MRPKQRHIHVAEEDPQLANHQIFLTKLFPRGLFDLGAEKFDGFAIAFQGEEALHNQLGDIHDRGIGGPQPQRVPLPAKHGPMPSQRRHHGFGCVRRSRSFVAAIPVQGRRAAGGRVDLHDDWAIVATRTGRRDWQVRPLLLLHAREVLRHQWFVIRRTWCLLRIVVVVVVGRAVGFRREGRRLVNARQRDRCSGRRRSEGRGGG